MLTKDMFKIPLKSKRTGLALMFILLAGSLALSGFYYQRYQKALSTDPDVQIKQITNYLSHFIELPNEQPTLGTVLDKAKLTNSTLAQKAENGDKMLIYAEAQRLLLYRPSTKKLVDVLLIQNGDNLSTTSQATKVALLNGTPESSLTALVAGKLTEKVTKITISKQVNANRSDYAKTLIVDPSGKFSALAKDIASALNAVVGSLPNGEVQPADSDIVVLIGRDQ